MVYGFEFAYVWVGVLKAIEMGDVGRVVEMGVGSGLMVLRE